MPLPDSMIRPLAISLCFAGLRPKELCRLRQGAVWETWPIRGNGAAGDWPPSKHFYHQVEFVGSGRFRDLPKSGLGQIFSSYLLAMKRGK